MKTDELIALLAADTVQVAQRGTAWPLGLAVVSGLVLAAIGMQLVLGVRADLAQAVLAPMFWMKVIVPAAVAVAGFATLTRLARPGVPARTGWAVMAVPIVLLWSLALAAYVAAPPHARAALVWGHTWQVCPVNIALLSTPIFVAAFVALRQLAPTHPGRAGACAGALSGAAGAMIYAFHCPEAALPFMAIWYVVGMAVPLGVGAWLGPRVLRW